MRLGFSAASQRDPAESAEITIAIEEAVFCDGSVCGAAVPGPDGELGSLGNVDDYPTEFYIEARYHYSPQGGRVPTKIVPVTFWIRW
jgi:hypothetical protein